MFFTKKLRFFFRFFIALIKKHYLLLIAGAFIGAVFFVIYPLIVKVIPPPKKTLKIGLVGQGFSNEFPDEVLKDLSFGLVSISEKGEPLPNIAKSWTATDEGKTYIFEVPDQNKNSKLFWHDGKQFSISDVNYNFKDATLSTDNNKIIFKLKEAFSPFPSILSKPLFRKGLVGLGSYKVKKIVKKGKRVESVLLTPVNDSVLPNKLYRFYNNESDLKTGFNLGEVNYIPEVFDTEGLELSPSVKVSRKLMEDAYTAVFLSTNQAPFIDKSFRQALAYAIPKPSGEERATGPLNPNSWAYNPDVKLYSFDLGKANLLLEKEKIDLKNIKIKITTLPQHESEANQIKDSWKNIGIESEVIISSFVPEDFDVLLIARKIPNDPDQYYFWHSTQAGNISRYKSPRLDKLLEEGRKMLDKEERKTIFFDFQRFLVEESPAIFLIHPTYYEVIRD